MKKTPFQRIYAVVSTIPAGKVMTYKRISILADVANAHIVGFAMRANKDPFHIPCHRVLKSDGTLAAGYAFGGNKEKIKKLSREGIVFDKEYRVNLSLFEYLP
jgi:methylated-DNA-protein-cysteine methyltransferase-like protein